MAIPPGYLEASYIHEIPGSTKPMVNVWGHLDERDDVSGGPPEQVLWDEWVLGPMKCINNDIRLREVVIRVGTDGGAPTIASWTGGDSQGTLPGEALPNNCATLIKKNTTLGGRAGRGRCYLPPVGEDSSGGGRIEPSLVAFIQGTMNTWLATLETRNLSAVLLHSSPSGPNVPTPIVSLTCDSLLATQRRRLR